MLRLLQLNGSTMSHSRRLKIDHYSKQLFLNTRDKISSKYPKLVAAYRAAINPVCDALLVELVEARGASDPLTSDREREVIKAYGAWLWNYLSWLRDLKHGFIPSNSSPLSEEKPICTPDTTTIPRTSSNLGWLHCTPWHCHIGESSLCQCWSWAPTSWLASFRHRWQCNEQK